MLSNNTNQQDIQLVHKSNNGQTLTTSRIIAEVFKKRHADVLKAIQNLECSQDFQERNFSFLFEIRQLPNGGRKEEPYYAITRDGFTFLAMGFTGKRASQFKEKFIHAFNTMEKALQSDFKLPTTMKEVAMLLLQSEEEKEKLIKQKDELLYRNRNQEKLIKQNEPRVMYYNNVLQSKNTYNINQIAQDLGTSARALNLMLKELRIQYKQNNQWLLFSKHRDKGYTKSKTIFYRDSQGVETTTMHTVWTEKGREFLMKTIKSHLRTIRRAANLINNK